MPGQYAVGLDVGATKILGGVVDCTSGTIISNVKNPSPAVGAEAVLSAIEDTIAQALKEAPDDIAHQVQRIGVGLAGQVDSALGMLHFAPNLGGGVKDVAIANPLEARFNIPVKVGNDVEVAALGESRFGAGRGSALFACVFVGTGVGGALIENGVRFRGATGSAGEVGHIMLREGGRMCGCGQRGHLEAYASRSAIVKIMREEVEAGAHSVLRELLLDRNLRIKSKPLAEAVTNGDPLAVNIMTQAGKDLGLGLASLANLWNPERIVLGGGVIDRIDLLFNVAVEQARRSALGVASANLQILRAALGDNSGLVGAALLE